LKWFLFTDDFSWIDNIYPYFKAMSGLLHNFFQPRSLPSGIVEENWKYIDERLLKAFVSRQGIHFHEYQNFDSFMPEILKLAKEHVKFDYLDEKDNLHTISVVDCYFVRPYENRFGLDNPEQALIRNNYEATVRSTVMYTIHRKTNSKDVDMTDINHIASEDNNTSDGMDDESDASDSENSTLESDDEVTLNDFRQKNTTSDKPAFYFENIKHEEYTDLIHKSVKHNHLLMDVPVWINSSLCHMGGPYSLPSLYSKSYFDVPVYCVSRNFKVCPYEEYYINNRILSMKPNKVEIRSRFYQQSKKFRTNSTLKITLDAPKIKKNCQWEQPSRFLVEIPHEKPKCFISVTVLAMAFGWSAVEFVNAVKMCLGKDHGPEVCMFLNILASDTEKCTNQTEAICRISKCLAKCRSMIDKEAISSYVSYTLRGEFLPNMIETESSDYSRENVTKGYALAQAVTELIRLSPLVNNLKEIHEKWQVHDKRAYAIKRIECPGDKLSSLSRKYLKTLARKGSSKLKYSVENGKRIDLNSILNKKIIKLTASVKNGVWDSKTDTSDHNQNKTQMMTTGFCSDSNHMQTQKIIKFSMKKNCDPGPLLTHPDQTGRVDLYLTPESEKCGVARNSALGLQISPYLDMDKVSRVVQRVILTNIDSFEWIDGFTKDPPQNERYYMVHNIYGGMIGWTGCPLTLYKTFVTLRRKQIIHRFFSIELDTKRKSVFFNIDEGRLLRPLIILDHLSTLVQVVSSGYFTSLTDPISHLLQQGLIEYLDSAEEMCGVVLVADCLDTVINSALKNEMDQTHLEPHGCLILNMTVSKAFATSNQGPRRMYTGNMEKRSISLKLHEDRGTTASYSLWYAQTPLLSEPVDKALNLREKEPNGININVAVLSMDENQEDAWIVKKEAIERGLAVSVEHHVITGTLSIGCIFAKPDDKCKGKASKDKYAHLSPDGIPKIGSIIPGGGAVIGKVFQCKVAGELVNRCVSKFIPWNVAYTIRSVTKYPEESKDTKIIRVVLQKINHPVIGDKLFLAHGQKGTIGRITPSVDLPFITTGPNAGSSPDLFINVCSLMRVTQGLLQEIQIGKARGFSPDELDQYDNIFMSKRTFATKLTTTAEILKRYGLNYKGKELMTCGKTGRTLKCEIFNGIASMRVLKHMARDKLRSRDRGPTNELTRQTTVGKKHFGGQKAGEMENWNFHCHGVPFMFQNVNYESADKFMIFFCLKCNWYAIGCVESNFYFCKMCENKDSDKIVRLKVPYTTCLTFQEMYTAGWGHTFIAEEVSKLVKPLITDDQQVFHNHQT
jgi:DNA-directed RNA polymerase beta subunit